MVKRILAGVVVVLGLASMALGIAFIAIGQDKENYLTQAMTEEKITLTLSEEQVAAGEFVNTTGEAQTAADLVRSHRHGMGTYDEVLGGAKFDPTNPEHLSYGQALNLENYLYLAVASFGLTTLAKGAGVGLLLAGIAVVIIGALLLLAWRREHAASAAGPGGSE